MPEQTTEPPKLLSADEILATPDYFEEDVFIKEWGGAVRVRSLSMVQVNAINKQARVIDRRNGKPTGESDNDKIEELMFLRAVVSPAFSPEQYRSLQNKAAGPVNRVLAAINRVSGLTEVAVRDATKSAGDGPDATDAARAGAGAA